MLHRLKYVTLLGFAASVAALSWAEPALALTKVACVGDSITYGYGLASRDTESYPAVLETLLGSEYDVGNFGENGKTALKTGDNPYYDSTIFDQSTTFAPNIVVLMLGTNDSKPGNWDKEASFEADYTSLVQYYRDLGAEVYIMIPPPAAANPGWWQIELVIPHIQNVAAAMDAPVIDIHALFDGHLDWYGDDVHPNATGDQHLAQTVYAALTGGEVGGAGGASGNGGTSSAGTSTAGTSTAGASQGGTSQAGTSAVAGTGGTGTAGTSTAGTGGTGGTGSSVGGSVSSGGTSSGGSTADSSSGDSSGCSLARGAPSSRTAFGGFGLFLLGLSLVRRARSRAHR